MPFVEIPRVEFHDLPAEIDTERYTVLDVRGAAEYAGEHVPGALNIAHTRLADRIAEVPKDKPVLAYSSAGLPVISGVAAGSTTIRSAASSVRKAPQDSPASQRKLSSSISEPATIR